MKDFEIKTKFVMVYCAVVLGALLLLLLFNGCTQATESPQGSIATPLSSDTTEFKTKTLDDKFNEYGAMLSAIPGVDFKSYCGHEIKNKDAFYSALLKNMAKHESGLKNSSTFYECNKTSCVYSSGCFQDKERGHCMKSGSKLDDGFVVSRGLFQMSISSARGLGCLWLVTPQDLHDENKNIKCAVLALDKFITQDKKIAGRDGKYLGASRYWAVMREFKKGVQKKSYAEIKKASCGAGK